MAKKNIILFLALYLIIGCSNPVDTVRNSTLRDIDRSVTIGDVVNAYKYFKKREWKNFETAQKRNIVQFTGTIDIDKWLPDYKNTWQYQYRAINLINYDKLVKKIKSIKCIIQFYMLKNGKGFDIGYQEIDVLYKDGKVEKIQTSPLLQDLYRNDPITF